MTLISRIGSAFLFLAVVLPAVSAHGGGNNNNDNGCGAHEFLLGWKNSCVPHGGRPQRPNPPKGSDCPPSKWYWGDREGCCVPEEPPKHEDPEPQCRRGWKWLTGEHRCCEDNDHPPPGPPPPHPSGNPTPPGPPGHGPPGQGPPGHGPPGQGPPGPPHHNKRSNKSRMAALCPAGLEACPIAKMSTDYECLDTTFELESCGGCVALGKGQDCTAIKGAWNVGCEQGSCKVYTCAAGYKRSADGQSCVAH